MNFMMYNRGNRKDYEEWEEAGNPGWGYEEVLPFFKISEDFLAYNVSQTQKIDTVSKNYHSQNGPLTVNVFEKDPLTISLREALYKAGYGLGYPKNIDVNGQSQIGLTDYQETVDQQYFRQSTAKAFLQNIPNNLKVCKSSIVNKVILKKLSAVGVKFLYKNEIKTVRTRKEIILSAGAFNTPSVLERSGVGAPHILDKVGIKTVHPLQGVGENLQDHFFLFGNIYKVDVVPRGPPNVLSTLIASFGGFVDTLYNSSVPDIQLIFTFRPRSPNLKMVPFVDYLNFRTEIGEQYSVAARESSLLSAAPTVLRSGIFFPHSQWISNHLLSTSP